MTGQRIARRAAACAAVAVLAATGGTAAQAGDDIDSLPAEQIAERSRKALLDVRSVHLRARGDLGENRSPMTSDLSLDRSGNCAGGVDLGEDRGSVEIVKRGDDVWLKPDTDFWENQVPIGGQAFEDVLAGRYMKGSASDPRLRPVVEACDLDTFRELVADDAGTAAGAFTKGEVTRVDGVRTVPVTRALHGQELTTYVKTGGEHHPVRITVRGDGADAAVDFSGFDEPVPAATPSVDETVDVSTVLGRKPAQS